MMILRKRAKIVGKEGEVPITAIILNEKGHCIGHGRNTRNKRFDPMGHAELVALRQAAWLKGDWRFNECTLIVTLEPCQMCAGALIQARMGRVIFGAYDFKRGGLGGTLDLSTHKSAHHKMIVKGGVMKKEIKQEIEEWFSLRRLIKL
ncbi:tRNA-specific adenosine-34 deaminase [Prochlorococcus marinus str. SS51]|nr:tRNA-specific adenosine-34 deaminase [Prochlorococcus marinus str. SS2]KGG23450.1 tRNA-specific adenosine-34 deaminase [Prochlorococcus marinus str. SS35]KGG32314.1 tRNA-specific adenosine-34 deaminase [Prochlorococcus marinus str. SS51]